MTQAQLEDPDGHRLVAAIHQRKRDAMGTSTAGMWHDPDGVVYPYDDEDLRIINAAKRAKLEQDRADCMKIGRAHV